MNAHGWAQTVGVKEPVTDWLIGLAADLYDERGDCQTCATSGHT
jgi:hypothetical protein